MRPAYATRAEIGKTLGPEVADLAALANYPPDPEQELLLDATFATGDDARSRFFEVDVICCRQNLKTGFIKQAELGWLYITDQRLVVHSAHEMGTTREAFRDLVELIEGCSTLSARLKPSRNHGIDNGAGREGIELRTGQRIRYKARTSGGGRGLSGDKVVLDEGMFLRADHMGALLPTLSARPDPQVIVGSSAGLAVSEVLRRIRDRGRGGTSPAQFYAEWCAPDVPCADLDCDHEPGHRGCTLDDESAWVLANPQLGRRMSIDKIRAERQASPPGEFARERLGWWDDPADQVLVFSPGAWEACRDDRVGADGMSASKIAGRPSIALAVSPDRSRASLVVAGVTLDGPPQVETVDHDRGRPGHRLRGTSWLVDRARQVAEGAGVRRVSLDRRSAAGSLVPDLQREGLVVDELSTEDYARACGAFFDAVEDRRLRHLGQPDLDAAVRMAKRRAMGDAWKWDARQVAGDVTALVAATIAFSRALEPTSISAWSFADLEEDA